MSLVSRGLGPHSTLLTRGLGKTIFVIDPDTPVLPRPSGGGRVTLDKSIIKTKTIVIQDSGKPSEVEAIFLNPKDFEDIEVIAELMSIKKYEVRFIEDVILLDDNY